MSVLAAWLGPFANEPSVSVDLPPAPETGVGWLQPIAVLVLVISVAAILRHRRRLREHGIGGLRSFALGAAVGNALMDLGSILMPNRPAAVSVESLEQHVEKDGYADGRDPPARAGASAGATRSSRRMPAAPTSAAPRSAPDRSGSPSHTGPPTTGPRS